MAWWDFFKTFTYAFTDDPLTKRDRKDPGGAGVSQHGAVPDIRGGQNGQFGGGGGGAIKLRDTNDFVDLSTVTNRLHRYKEYERLRSMAEIEMAMTVFADEACLSGNTRIATLHGFRTLRELTETQTERFLVYCYDFDKKDYTLGWAFNPHKVKTAKTIKISFDDGNYLIATPDHKVLLRNETWIEAGELDYGHELMPFYRVEARQDLTNIKTNQFPRIWTHDKGWMHERQFADEWSTGIQKKEMKMVNTYCQMIAEGLTVRQISELTKNDFVTVRNRIRKAGFSNKELKWLSNKADRRRVLGSQPWKEIDVYDMSVEKHKNFATNWGIVHNCQRDDDGRALNVVVENEEIKEELEFLLFHRKMLNFDQRKTWDLAKRLFIMGDFFYEIIIDMEDPKNGIIGLMPLPPESVYRIETTKGKVMEFQQSKEGPDYESLARVEVTQATEADLQQATAIRFAPEQVVHIKIGDDRETFYPYGVSLIELARGPAHQLRLMEDAMMVYRLCIRSYDKIAIRNGWKYMKDITIDDTIYAYNQETKKVEEGKVAWHGLVGEKTTYKVSSKHTSVTGTDIHPIVVFDSETQITDYVKIKDLIPKQHHFVRPLLNEFEPKKINRYYKPLQVILSKEQKEKYKNTKYASKKDLIEESLGNCSFDINKSTIHKCWSFLSSKDNVSLPYELGITICNNFDLGDPIKKNKGEKDPERINVPDYVTEDFAMLFGFLLGDGCINWHKGSAKLLFAAGVCPKLNEKYCTIIKKFFGKCYFQQDKRIAEKLGNYCINSVTACEILGNLGFKGNAHEKRIPGWVFSERPEIRKALIKGFADADGIKRGMNKKTWGTTIRLCNRLLVEDVKQIWESLGYHASEVKEIQEPERWISGTYVPASTNWEVYISETEVPFHDEIVYIRKEGKEDVYDLTVEHPTEHNFLCNGVPVSNTRAPERRVFYIDVHSLTSAKAEAFIERMKDQFKKKKVSSGKGGGTGASAVEERWHAPAADEDYWIPLRTGSNTRIETLPGAQNLGEIDDTVYFRNKLFTALQFPKNYLNNEDAQSTRISLSAQDIKFARMIERLQAHIEDAFWEICDRHLRLRGFPEDSYEDLVIKMTPPSDWRELTRAEILTNRLNNAANIKGSQLMSDFDILTKFMKYSEDDAKEMLARLKIQKLEELKLQIIAQNPNLLGVGLPGPDDQEVGTEPGGPSPMLGSEEMGAQGDAMGMPPGAGDPQGMPTGAQGMRKYMDGEPEPEAPPGSEQNVPISGSANPLPDVTDSEIKKFDLEIKDFSQEMDEEEEDRGEEDW